MKQLRSSVLGLGCALALGFGLSHVSLAGGSQKHLILLQTNDIHGGVESQVDSQGRRYGGLSIFGGVVQAIRAGVRAEYGQDGGVLVLDDGDQFQGTLISNYNEGQLVFDSMAQVGYDAAITGNHDYDFGPSGWLDDVVTTSNPDKNPRGALQKLLDHSAFPLISANTFYKSTFYDLTGASVAVDGRSCDPIQQAGKPAPVIDWSRVQIPAFLSPYLIKNVAGLRVALIGIDNYDTSEITTVPDVADLCFGDEVQAYLRTRQALDGKADVFVMLLHDGDADGGPNLTNLLKKLTSLTPAPVKQGSVVDAVLAGHTHYVNNVKIAGVPGIQSGANGKYFGRVDLAWDVATGKVVPSSGKQYAGVELFYDQCDSYAGSMCAVSSGHLSYEGVPVTPLASIDALISAERTRIAPIAKAPIGTAGVALTVDRANESPLADVLTDLFREVSGADIAMMNTGGLRASLGPGAVTYEDLFRVLPFNNHGVVVGPMGADRLIKLLTRSAQACSNYGALMQSGLRVSMSKNCKPGGQPVGTDTSAALTHVETLSGEVILDVSQGITPKPGRVFQVATFDFLAEGGSGFTDFEGVPEIQDIGIVRERISHILEATQRTFDGKMDGRWKAVTP